MAVILLALAPALLFGGLLVVNMVQWRRVSRHGMHLTGRVVEIRTVKGGRSKSIAPVVEVSLPGGELIAVRTGEQNIFTRYKVGQAVPVILVPDKRFLKVYINTPAERLPPLLLVLTTVTMLAAALALKQLVV